MQNQTFKIGLLVAYADLYNRLRSGIKEQLQQIVDSIIAELQKEDVHFVRSEAVCTRDQVKIECDKLIDQNIDVLFVSLAPYCPSGVLAPVLSTLNKPIVLWPTQTMYQLEPENYHSSTITFNHGVHAVQDLANVLRKNGRHFGLLHGHWQQDDFKEKMVNWARAARALGALQSANPVQIGGHFEDMLDLQIGADDFIKESGINHQEISLDTLFRLMRNVPEDHIRNCIDSYHETFHIHESLTKDLLVKAARGELAVKEIMTASNSHAVGINFLALCNDERIADPLHVAGSVLMSEGYGYAAEGDWVTASFIYAMQQSCARASFSEIFSVDYAGGNLVLRHWGEGNYTMARAKPRLSLSTLNDINKADFAIVDFEFKPGKVTLLNLNSDVNGKGQLIALTGTITEGHLPQASGPRAVFHPDCSSVAEMLDRYAFNGGSHHLALVEGHQTKFAEMVCTLAGWTYIRMVVNG